MKRARAAALAIAVAAVPGVAAAKLDCYPLAQIERALDSEYGEMRRFAGKESAGIEYRLYINARTGSWSWIGIPAGTEVGCLIFAGQTDAPPSAGPPARPEAQF